MLSQKGFSPLLVLIIVAVVVGSISFSPSSQNVLGEESEEVKKAEEEVKKAEEQAKEATKKAAEEQKEAAKKAEEAQKEDSKSKIESISPTGIKSKAETEGKKRETEIETPTGQKIKTKVEDDGTTKVEIEQGKLKLKYKFENGQLKLKAENEQGKEVEVDDEKLDEMGDEAEEELEKKGIRIATGSGKPVLAKNNVAALTDFPLSVDVATNQLIVTTPAGQKVVTILPDQAIQNLLDTNIINKVDSSTDSSLTDELGQLSGVVKLETKNDKVVYKVKGTKSHRLLGFIPVDASTTVFVSAETGETVETEQPLITNIIDLLSP